ncbi:Serine/threonine protein kinase [Dorcoceras hygrometricum]|uniref:Serine/threonine protein kinase n=1 Tax=Dorcoceras hygrometricum TaxID=472368 RepID=A0A2Z7AQD2_9LAMI|nr:Serine/threonine protein kinase [Dorcoceras hygrometricum]
MYHRVVFSRKQPHRRNTSKHLSELIHPTSTPKPHSLHRSIQHQRFMDKSYPFLKALSLLTHGISNSIALAIVENYSIQQEPHPGRRQGLSSLGVIVNTTSSNQPYKSVVSHGTNCDHSFGNKSAFSHDIASTGMQSPRSITRRTPLQQLRTWFTYGAHPQKASNLTPGLSRISEIKANDSAGKSNLNNHRNPKLSDSAGNHDSVKAFGVSCTTTQSANHDSVIIRYPGI